jgi:SHS family lactate transporter-like MFS transporter
MEKVPPRWRGVFSGLLQQGYPCGYLLAACCFRFLPEGWSWRALFFIGCLPAMLALFVCYKVEESAVWRRNRAETWTGLGRAVARHWKLFLYLMVLMTMMNLSSHGTQDLYPSFLEQERHLSKAQVGNIAIVYNLGALAGGVFFGLLSDRIGRRRSMVLALLVGVGMIPLWSSGAYHRIVAQRGAWFSAGIRLSVRRPGGRERGARRGATVQGQHVFQRDGDDGFRRLLPRRPGDRFWTGTQGGGVYGGVKARRVAVGRLTDSCRKVSSRP